MNVYNIRIRIEFLTINKEYLCFMEYYFGSNILESIFIINKYFKFRIFQSYSLNYLTKIML